MTNSADSITRWLETATKGLPSHAAQMARDEIGAHYADSVAEYRAMGKTEAEARRVALADLGDVRATARALRDAHLARRRYAIAAAACLVYPVTLGLLSFLEATVLRSDVLTEFVYLGSALISILYALSGLKRLLGHEAHSSRRLFALIAWAFVVADVAILASQAVFGQRTIANTTRRGLHDATTFLQAAFDLVDLGGEVIGATGLLLLGARLAKVENPLYGLRGLVSWLAITVGGTLLISVVTAALNIYIPAVVATLLGMVALVVTFALLALLFFRAAYRGPRRPAQIA
jgi:hypothetical protein